MLLKITRKDSCISLSKFLPLKFKGSGLSVLFGLSMLSLDMSICTIILPYVEKFAVVQAKIKLCGDLS